MPFKTLQKYTIFIDMSLIQSYRIPIVICIVLKFSFGLSINKKPLNPQFFSQVECFFKLLFHSFLIALGLCCCAWAFSSCSGWGSSSFGTTAPHRGGWLLFLNTDQSTDSRWAGFSTAGSVVVAQSLSCSMICEIFPDQ